MDELDKILAGYDKPADNISGGGSPQPGTGGDSGPAEVIPGENARKSTPFSITHNPGANDAPPTEYYVRGPKKGQPKPPSKSHKKTTTPGVAPTSIPASALMTGAMFMTMIDLILPMGIVALHNWQYPKAKIDVKDFKMKPDQKNELAPIADAVARELNINASPTALLLVGLVGIYSMNMMVLHNEAVAKNKIDEKTKKDSAKTDNNGGARTVPFTPN